MFDTLSIQTLTVAVFIYLFVLSVAIFYILFQIDALVARTIGYTVRKRVEKALPMYTEECKENQETQCKVAQMDNVSLDCCTDGCDILYESAKKINKPLFELNSDYEGPK